jgi:hypothetical protein
VKRDMELIRTIFLRAQDADFADLSSADVVTEDWSELVVAEHMHLLRDAGYIEASIADYEQAGALRGIVLRLTWEGTSSSRPRQKTSSGERVLLS